MCFRCGADAPQRGADVLLLDVRVKGVEEQSDRRMVHRVAERHAVRRGVQKIRFEAVERLDGERDVVFDERVAIDW